MKGINVKGLLMVAGMSASIFATASTNMFTNGGFENNPNGAAYGWGGFDVGGDTAKATRVIDSTTGGAKEGKNFCRIKVTAVSGSDWHVQQKDPSWVAKVGYVYHFSIWARSDSSRPAAISVYGGPDGITTYRTGSSITLTTEWKQYHQIFIAEVAGTGVVNFALVVGKQKGTYDFDGAELTEGAPNNSIYQNGSFEADNAGWSLWVKPDSSTAKATMTFPTTGAKSGSKFCRIDVTSAAAKAYEIQLQDGPWVSKLNYRYTFKFWAKADSARTVTVVAQPGQTRSYADLAIEDKPLTTTWVEQTFIYTTFDLEGADSLSFVIFFGAAKGKYDLDSMTLVGELDTTGVTQQNMRGLRTAMLPLSITLLPERLQCMTAEAVAAPFNVNIFSVQGRLFSTRTVSTTGREFDLPRPPSGAWIVRVNSNPGSMITIP